MKDQPIEKPASNDPTDAAYQRRLVDQRLGPNAMCSNCRHAYKVRLDATSIETHLECRGAPPLFQFVQAGVNQQGQPVMTNMQVRRVVHPQYSCGAFFMLPKDALQ